ncbi:hypothetical protein D3C87_1189560 [compost metagenome]
MAASAVLRQASRTSLRRLSSGLASMPRNKSGSAMQAAINDSRITPAAMNISRSRSGNAPPPMSIGTDITPASVTAPRTPPTVSNQQDRAVGTWVTSPLPRKRRSSTDNPQRVYL